MRRHCASHVSPRKRAAASERSSNVAMRPDEAASAASDSLKSRTATWAIFVTCGTSRRTLNMIEAWENSNPS